MDGKRSRSLFIRVLRSFFLFFSFSLLYLPLYRIFRYLLMHLINYSRNYKNINTYNFRFL